MAAAESPGARHHFPEPPALQLCGEGGKVAALRACLCPMGPSVCRETGGWCVVVFNARGQYRGQGGNSQDWDMAGALEGHQGGSHRFGDGLCLTSRAGNSFLLFFLLLKNTCWSWWSWKVKHSPSCQAQHSGRDGILSHAPGLIFFAAAVSKQKQSSWPQGRPAAWVRARQARSLLLGCFPSVNSASSPAGTRKKKRQIKQAVQFCCCGSCAFSAFLTSFPKRFFSSLTPDVPAKAEQEGYSVDGTALGWAQLVEQPERAPRCLVCRLGQGLS